MVCEWHKKLYNLVLYIYHTSDSCNIALHAHDLVGFTKTHVIMQHVQYVYTYK